MFLLIPIRKWKTSQGNSSACSAPQPWFPMISPIAYACVWLWDYVCAVFHLHLCVCFILPYCWHADTHLCEWKWQRTTAALQLQGEGGEKWEHCTKVITDWFGLEVTSKDHLAQPKCLVSELKIGYRDITGPLIWKSYVFFSGKQFKATQIIMDC